MARTKKEANVEVNETVQEEEVVVEEKKKSVKKVTEPVATEESAENEYHPSEKFLEKVQAEIEKKKTQKKLYLTSNTPYLKSPDKNHNVAGILEKGKLLYVEEEINDPEKGDFYKVGYKQYINKLWPVEVL